MNTQISNLSGIDVVILAGGFGTRLQSKTLGKPKALIEIGSRPFLEYILYQLSKANFKNVILCTGYLSDQVEKTFGAKYKDLNLIYSPEQSPLGTGGSLRNALPLLKSEIILVMNGDSFCELDFEKFWQFHLNKESEASLVLSLVPDARRFGTVELGSDESITRFVEKGNEIRAGLVSAGIYFINKDLISKIPEGKQISIEKDIFPTWVGRGFYGYKCENSFIDIGTPESYAQAEQFLSKF